MPASKRLQESPPSDAEPREPADRLDLARQLAAWLVGLVVLGPLVLALGPALRAAAHPDVRVEWVRALGEPGPSLWPAARTERLDTSHPSIRPTPIWGVTELAPPLAERR